MALKPIERIYEVTQTDESNRRFKQSTLLI